MLGPSCKYHQSHHEEICSAEAFFLHAQWHFLFYKINNHAGRIFTLWQINPPFFKSYIKDLSAEKVRKEMVEGYVCTRICICQEMPCMFETGSRNLVMEELVHIKLTTPCCSSSVHTCNTLVILKLVLLDNRGMLGYSFCSNFAPIGAATQIPEKKINDILNVLSLCGFATYLSTCSRS